MSGAIAARSTTMEKWLPGAVSSDARGSREMFTDLPRARVAMETGTHSIWVSEQLRELGHEVVVANVRELRPISHSTVAQQEAPDVDSCPQRDRSSADGGGELSTWTGKAVRPPASGHLPPSPSDPKPSQSHERLTQSANRNTVERQQR